VTRAAEAVRDLGHALVAHQADADPCHRVALVASELAAAVAAQPARVGGREQGLERLAQPVAPDGSLLDHGQICPESGAENPFGLAMTTRRAGEEVAATVVLGAAAAGVPGVAHGGMITALLDDVMGFFMESLEQAPGVTATLNVSFRMPVQSGPSSNCADACCGGRGASGTRRRRSRSRELSSRRPMHYSSRSPSRPDGGRAHGRRRSRGGR
jgi:hypothetical protein